MLMTKTGQRLNNSKEERAKVRFLDVSYVRRCHGEYSTLDEGGKGEMKKRLLDEHRLRDFVSTLRRLPSPILTRVPCSTLLSSPNGMPLDKPKRIIR